MCAAIEFKGRNVYFRDESPQLPVLLKRGLEGIDPEVIWIPWGVPYGNNEKHLPEGAYARLESIKQGKWNRWHARPVQLPVSRFMERDPEKREVWFDLSPGEVIQGCLANDAVVYVVTVPAPTEFAHIHDRWPRVV